MNITELAIYKIMFGKSNGTNDNPSDNPSVDNELIGKWVLNSEPLDMSYLTKYTSHFDGVIKIAELVFKGQYCTRVYGLSCGNDLALTADFVKVGWESLISDDGTFVNGFNGELEILAIVDYTDEFKAWLKANATKVS